MADALGWDERRCAEEVAAYLARVAAERRSHVEADDPAAGAVRVAAPDSRLTTVVA